MKQTKAHDAANPHLLSLMPAGCARVLEVGCSSGALAAAYKAQNSNSLYIGVEIDPTSAELARQKCDRVVTGNFETLSDAEFDDLLPADCVVFGDTIEHFRDPWDVLNRVASRMRPDDVICACIPNAQHWSMQANLATGRFHYADSGLLDRTHLRFFTWITIQHLFASAGFQITTARTRNVDNTVGERFLPAIRAMAEAAGVDADDAVRFSLPYQFVVSAKRAD